MYNYFTVFRINRNGKETAVTNGKKAKITSFIPEGKLEKAKFFLSILLSLALIATAVCFIVSCISIYKSDSDTPFSRETVKVHLKKVAPISFVSIALLTIGGIISLFAKHEKIKNIPIKKKTLLRIFSDKLSAFSVSQEYISLKKEEKAKRFKVVLSALLLSLVFTAAALIFVLNPSRYTLEDVNTDIAYLVVIAAISTLLIFAICYTASAFLDKSYSAELEKAKEELKALRLTAVSDFSADKELIALSKNEGHTVNLVRAVIIVIAIAFIIAGIFNGGMADVLGKAVRICTECIGLG